MSTAKWQDRPEYWHGVAMIAETATIADMATPHERLEHLRERRGWSRSAVARMLDKPRSTVDTWFTGQLEPGVTDLIALADLFEVSLDVLCGREERPAELTGPERYVLQVYRDLRLDPSVAARAMALASVTPPANPTVEMDVPVLETDQPKKKKTP